MIERKDVRIQAVVARMGVRAPRMTDIVKDSVLFDPERPHMGPNELLKEIGDDPTLLKFNCPFCHKDMTYALFVAHIPDTKAGKGCTTRNWSTIDVTNRRFKGASIGGANG